MRSLTRIALAGGAALAALSVPLVSVSGAAPDPQTAPPATIDLTTLDPQGLLEAARTEFDEYLSGFPDLTENLSLSECPLQAVVDVLALLTELGVDQVTAGLDATIYVAEAESAADGTSPASTQVVPIGVVCDTPDDLEVRPAGTTGGVYGLGVAVFDYGLAPDIDLSALPAEFPELIEPSVATLGFTGYRGCIGGSEETGTTQCYSWWERDRFVLGMYLTVDRENVDESLALVQEVSQARIQELLANVRAGLPQVEVVTETTTATD